VRHENWGQVGPAIFGVPELPGTFERAGVDDYVIVVKPVKRKRALLGSNPPRNSRPETHRDKANADESRSSVLLLRAQTMSRVHACHGRFPHALKNPTLEAGLGDGDLLRCWASNSAGG
jgi:hypothetical protein